MDALTENETDLIKRTLAAADQNINRAQHEYDDLIKAGCFSIHRKCNE